MNNGLETPNSEALKAYCDASVRVGQMSQTQRREILTLAGINPDKGENDE